MGKRRRASGISGNVFLDQVEQATVAALEATGKVVLKRAKELVPLEDGGLRRSGRVTSDHLLVSVSFKHPLAYLQHERLDYQHTDGRQAKYLEQAVQESNVIAVTGKGIAVHIRGERQ